MPAGNPTSSFPGVGGRGEACVQEPLLKTQAELKCEAHCHTPVERHQPGGPPDFSVRFYLVGQWPTILIRSDSQTEPDPMMLNVSLPSSARTGLLSFSPI